MFKNLLAKTQLKIKLWCWKRRILSLAYSKLSTQLVNNRLQAGPNPLNSSELDSLALNYPNNHVVLNYKNTVEIKVTLQEPDMVQKSIMVYILFIVL